jgi:hypothetical protein
LPPDPPRTGSTRPTQPVRPGGQDRDPASKAAPAGGSSHPDFFSSERDHFEPPPSRWRTILERLKRLDTLAFLRRLAALAALVIILIALAYAMFPFKAGASDCSPAIIQVFDRQRLTPPAAPGQPPGPPITTPTTTAPGATPAPTPKGVVKPCTKKAQHRLYYAVPIIVLALIGSAGVQRILS